MSQSGGDAIFLTGATGLVGGLLLRRMAKENSGREIFALVRNGSALPRYANVHAVVGDITQESFGIARNCYLELTRSVRTIVHSAALTGLLQTLPASREVNVQGTANVIQFARHCSHLQKLVHVSSTYVAGRNAGELPEEMLLQADGWFSPYEQSKFEAEALLHSEAAGLPWVIARLSTVVGNSHTGHVSQMNYFHQLIRLIPRNPFPFIPGKACTLVDIVADDWVTEGLFRIAAADSVAGTVFHLCAGPVEAIPAGELLERAFALHRGYHPASRAVMPSFVPPAEFASYAAQCRAEGSGGLSRMADLALSSLPHLDVNQLFLNGKTNNFLEAQGLVPPRAREFFPRIAASLIA